METPASTSEASSISFSPATHEGVDRVYDVAVVGAGPAGSTVARYAARRGLKVLLLDRRREIGVPVQCGEYVATDEEVQRIFPGVTDLGDLMVAAQRAKQIDTPTIRIWSPKGRHWDIPFKGYTVRRDKMDQGIADEAIAEGAELRTETTVQKVRDGTVVTNHGEVEAKVIVGADGPRSTVARDVGLPWPVSAPAMSCTVDGEFDAVTHLYFGNLAPGGYAWIIPKGSCANVGLGTWEHYRGRLDVLFRKFLDRHDLPHVRGTGGYVPVLGPVPRSVKGRVLLVGDAAGHVMATNGGGNNVAMIAGRIAGNAASDHVLQGTPLDAYEAGWRSLVGDSLDRGRRIKKLADRFFGSDRLLEAAMVLLGAKRMARAIRCQRVFIEQ